MSDAPALKLLAQHAVACWVTEGLSAAHIAHEMRSDYRRALYFRTRAVVLYDRLRTGRMGNTAEVEFGFVNRRGTAPGGA